jgi:hypothetical protein
MKKIAFIFVLIFIIAVLSVSFISCKAAIIEQDPFDRSAIKTLPVDEKVSVGDITWDIMEVEYLGSEIPSTEGGLVLEPTYGRFISVEFTVENTGEEVRTIINLVIIDSKGREFPVCAEVYGYLGADDACLLVDVAPGASQDFYAAFDVPLDSVDLILEVSDLGAPPVEKAYIDLGL